MSNKKLRPYDKKPLPFREQAKIQISRGLQDIDVNELEKVLTRINYYRFTGYLYHRRAKNSKNDNYKKIQILQNFKDYIILMRHYVFFY